MLITHPWAGGRLTSTVVIGVVRISIRQESGGCSHTAILGDQDVAPMCRVRTYLQHVDGVERESESHTIVWTPKMLSWESGSEIADSPMKP